MLLDTLTFILAGAAMALASPAAPLEARDSGVGLKYCTDTNGAGNCNTVSAANSVCYDISADFNDKVSSIFIYPAKWKCYFFLDKRCSNGGYNLALASGAHNALPQPYNDSISSYICQFTG